MEKRKNLIVVCLLFFAFTILSSMYLAAAPVFSKQQLYLLPSAQALGVLSGTFYPLTANLLFVKGVLELSDRIPERSKYLTGLFRRVAELDPRIEKTYLVGGLLVPRTRDETLRAISFLEDAAKLNPDTWRIPFWTGYSYLELGNYSKAIEYYKKAAGYPDAPSYLRGNLPFFYHQAHQYQQGAIYLESLLKTLTDPKTYEVMEIKLNWLKELLFLEKKVTDYQELYQSWPESLDDLVVAGFLEKIPEDKFGRGYYLESDSDRARPRVRSRF